MSDGFKLIKKIPENNKESNVKTSTGTKKVDSFYVFLDLESLNQNINELDLTCASFNIVTSEGFDSVIKDTFNFKTGQNEIKLLFQNFVQKLTDSIHSECIMKEKKYVFIVTSGWDLRVKFITLAKNMETQLPIYLEYPSYFDLKKEFIKYEELIDMVPFNSIDYNQTTLESIKNTLKLDNTDQNIELMISIAKKLDASSGAIDIMKKPHDMNLDLSHFFMEKSKILYMNNLSNDLTQAELETFFVQFSGHSIAFWLLKNPVLIDPQSSDSNTNFVVEATKTCSGFVIFSCHEDAMEALSFNGKVLNGKLIELQPSSLTVLDKARDILSPFPSSKNKPRPGDWNCPSCGFSNFQRRTACFRCSFPAASAATVQESMYGGENNNGNVGSNCKPKNDYGMNNYNNYGNTNNNSNSSNNVLYNINNNGSFNTHGGNSYGNINYINASANNTGNSNGPNSGYSSRQSSNVPFRAGDWKCINEACCYHNFAKNICCLKCGAPRVQSAIINGHAHGQHNNNNGEKNISKHNRSAYLMDSSHSSRSGSIPNQMNQLNQNQYNNYNKFKNNAADVFMNSIPNTPNGTRNGGTIYASNGANNSADFDLTNRIGNLSLNNNNTGENSVGSSISGSSGIPLMSNPSILDTNSNSNFNNVNLNGFNSINLPFGVNYGMNSANHNSGLGANDLMGMGNFDINTASSNLNYIDIHGLNTMNNNCMSSIGGGLNKINNLGLPLEFDNMNMGINTNLNINVPSMEGFGNFNLNGLGNTDAFSTGLGGGFSGAVNSPFMPTPGTPLSASNVNSNAGVSSLAGELERRSNGNS